ncbi:MAG: peptidase T [Ignavibacteria bacterium CG22_combo_CG10-13_8_21_14_all_37_15]|nr:MAG: peptidase T [Ignavibacteria bacterium CG1_02_37_35]PIP76396.1 MAG: peptidase T [Ignavibacteria bacterium CG22_combo_CG10-13_8_21_14_all_37_15]PIS45550.1 MAG: peptidase T [Ignavibacteria bacterium CG08_land_8_20_14_0_20_37_9]PJC57172.1 MAG: peptidase T [Ignavibacteria bacterium CG_4_9_14_0_2_um_filter_37_13]
MFDSNYKFTCVDRFLNYVKYDTQSDEEATCFPSSEKQKILSKDLADELKALGLSDAHMDENGYVMATLFSNTNKQVPTIGFIAHVDTSPAVSGANVQAVFRKNYQGGDIILEKDGQVIKAEDNPDLKAMLGYDIITTDGSTLLGADNKCGVAEIVDAIHYFLSHPEVKHGEIKVCFTPDEEVGRGTEKFDVKKFGAKYAYTVDGQTRGEVEVETFSADALFIKFQGKNIHPGYAKGKMINAIKVAAHFIDQLPKGNLSPETTDDREGYVHPFNISGSEEETTVKFIIRDFDQEKLKDYEDLLIKLAAKVVEEFPGARYTFQQIEQYRNMRYILDQHKQVSNYAIEAMERLNIAPKQSAIRGGTDGARLSFMGLPTPNIFAGEHSFHSKTEWVAIQDMEMAVRVIITIAQIWEEKS